MATGKEIDRSRHNDEVIGNRTGIFSMESILGSERRLDMKQAKKIIYLSIFLVFLIASLAYAGYEYSVEEEHLGGDVTPVDAYRMVQKDPQHTFLVDVRTRAEYQFVGHAEGACNIPFKFFTNGVSKKGYKLVENPDFNKDLLSRFNPQTDTLIFY